MKKVEVEKHQPSCLFAHELINKLAAIVGHSDLLKERLTGDAESLLRLDRIREIAAFTAQALAKHQCVLDAALKSQMAKKSVLPATGIAESSEGHFA